MDNAAIIGLESTSIKATGKKTTVPDDNIAKLMYYLSCANTCLENFVPEPLRDYQHYNRLTNHEKALVVTLAVLLSPDVLLGKVFFPVENRSPLLGGFSNEFYELSKARQLIGVAQISGSTILIDGKEVTVMKLMVFTNHWFNTNYATPLKKEIWRVEKMIKDSESKAKTGMKLSNAAQATYDDARQNPDFCGSLQKKGGFMPTWKNRFFVLKDQYLFYSKEKLCNPQGVLNLRNCEVIYDTDSPKYFSLKCCASASVDGAFTDRTYSIYAESSAEARQWVEAIRDAVNAQSRWESNDIPGLPAV